MPRITPRYGGGSTNERFAAGLAFGGSAISITGPYGSGKSTFGIMLSHLAAPKDDEGFGQALERIGGVYDDVVHDMMESRATAGIHKTDMIRCVVTARPEPVATTILRAIINGVESYFGADYDNLDFTYAGTLRRLSKTAKVPEFGINHRRDYKPCAVSPILLMIDEFGKNIEYFADEGIGGDLFLLQELTEMSGASRKIPLHIITMQHMAFGEYVAGTLACRMREWGKIQGRFEDVHFSNSLEHTRALPFRRRRCYSSRPRPAPRPRSLPMPVPSSLIHAPKIYQNPRLSKFKSSVAVGAFNDHFHSRSACLC